MSLNEQEIRQLLAIVMAYTDRKTPSDANVLAWGEAARRARWTYAEAEDAIHEHFTNGTAWLLPGAVTVAIKAARQDRAMREPIIRPDPIGQARLAELTAAAFQAVPAARPEPDRSARRAALARQCPFCTAAPGDPCTRAGRDGPVRIAILHPSRTEAAS